MRGIAILCIVFHNFLHLILPTFENEFDFSLSRVEVFTDSLTVNPAWALADVMSFFGWYGVAVFVFLSGYGLVRKYESRVDGHLSVWPFIKDRWLKVFKLMLVPMLLFAVVWSLCNGKIFPIDKLLQQLALIGNIAFPTSVQPGVYWFFGLIFELYVLYRLCIYRRTIGWIVGLNIFALALFVGLWLYGDAMLLASVRHNLFGWILPFTLGALFARYDFARMFCNGWVNAIVVIASGILLLAMNYNAYLWYFSPVVAIIASIALAKLWRGGVWLGALSSFLFVIHPIVRYIAIRPEVKALFGIGEGSPYTIKLIPLLASYVALSILAAYLYRLVHTRLFARR